MKKVIKKIINRFRYVNYSDAYILLYHSVEYEKNLNPLIATNVHNVSPDIFYRQLEHLKKKYTFISIDEMADYLLKGKRPKRILALTFDDGYKSVLNNALPVLQNLEIPATFYITKKLITEKSFWRDKVRYIIDQELEREFLQFVSKHNSEFKQINSFYWDTKNPDLISSFLVESEMDSFFKANNINLSNYQDNLYLDEKDIAAHPFIEFGNHTTSHYVLSSLESAKQAKDIKEAEEYLSSFEVPVSRVFSIPFGNPGTYNDDTIKILKELGYKAALLSGGHQVRSIDQNIDSKAPIVQLMRLMPKNQREIF